MYKLLLLNLVYLTTYCFAQNNPQLNTTMDAGMMEKMNVLKEAETTYRAHQSGKVQEKDMSGVLLEEYQGGNIQEFYPKYKNGQITSNFQETELRNFYYHQFNGKEYSSKNFDREIMQNKYEPILSLKEKGDIPQVREITETPDYKSDFMERGYNLYCMYKDNWTGVTEGNLAEQYKQGKLLNHKENLRTGYYDQVFNQPEVKALYGKMEQEVMIWETNPKPPAEREPVKVEKNWKIFEMHEQGKFDRLYKVIEKQEEVILSVISGNPLCFETILELGPALAVCNSTINDQKNWIQAIAYGEGNTVIADGKSFFDNLGRPTQSQAKLLSKNEVICTETVYDALGRGVLQSLPAPINQTVLCYKEKFITNPGHLQYTFDDFDKTYGYGGVNNPKPVGGQFKQGTLGFYYGSNNIYEDYVAETSFPYSRIEFQGDPSGRVRRASMPGEDHKMGQFHESWSFTMPASGELHYLFGVVRNECVINYYGDTVGVIENADLCKRIVPDYQITKTIGIDQNGRENVSFTDIDGNLVATCLAGKVNNKNIQVQKIASFIDVNNLGFIDIHLPTGCAESFRLQQNSVSPKIKYDIYTLDYNLLAYDDYTGDAPAMIPGFYRIVYAGGSMPANGLLKVSYDLNYYNFTLYQYDKANRLIKMVSPAGIDTSYAPAVKHFTYEKYRTISSFPTNPDLVFNLPQPTANNLQFTNLTFFLSEFDPCNPGSGNLYNQFFIPSWCKQPYNDAVYVPGNGGTNTNNNSGSASMAAQSSSGMMNTNMVMANANAVAMQLAASNSSGVGVTAMSANLTSNNTVGFAMTVAGTAMSQNVQATTATGSTGSGGASIVDTEPDDWKEGSETRTTYILSFNARTGNCDEVGWCGSVNLTAEHIISCTVGTCTSRWEFINSGKLVIKDKFSDNITGFTVTLDKITKIYKSGSSETLNPADFSSLGFDTIRLNVCVDSYVIGAGVPKHTMETTYEYNSLGWLLVKNSPDEGRTEYKYRTDGKIAFSQNAKQRNSTNFSYTLYDKAGRIIEAGQYDNYNASDYRKENFSTLQGNESLYYFYRTQKTVVEYDVADPYFLTTTGLSASDYKQTYLLGKPSKTGNGNTTSWYSYDELGRLKWMVQNIAGLGIKTINYKYNFQGNVLEVHYNKEDIDRFSHYYDYDADGRLINTRTSADNGATALQHAQYFYYTHGTLKRAILGDNLQGIDYTYNINGWLKGINHPSLNSEDPGSDGYDGSEVSKDVLGMALDYYPGDYENSNLDIQSGAGTEQFNGTVRSMRWKNRGITTDGNPQNAYNYGYDEKYQLKNSTYGTFNSSSGSFNAATNNKYKVYGTSYDPNGNLLSLKRNGNINSTSNQMDNFIYNYTQGTNKLNFVADDVPAARYDVIDIDGQSAGNYIYDDIGQMKEDKQQNIIYEYDIYGKITHIKDKTTNYSKSRYYYDDKGFRVKKENYDNTNSIQHSTWYVRDAAGNTMSIYEKGHGASATPITQTEVSVYGMSRIGMYYPQSNSYTYELTDHLGNVRAQIERNKPASGEANTIAYADYYPGGMLMPGRNYVSSLAYRYGYQGQFSEKDPETELNSFEFRNYDSRILRWQTTDLAKEFHSPYIGMGNNPVSLVDPKGLCTKDGPCSGFTGSNATFHGLWGSGMLLSEVEILGYRNKRFSLLNNTLIFFNGIARNTTSDFARVSTSLGAVIINQGYRIFKEGIRFGGEYSSAIRQHNVISPMKINENWELETWNLESNDELKELFKSTVNVVTIPLNPVSKTKIFNNKVADYTIHKVANTGVKVSLKKGAELLVK